MKSPPSVHSDSSQQPQQAKNSLASAAGCGRSTCKCGEDCRCSDEICCSMASSVMHSLAAATAANTKPSAVVATTTDPLRSPPMSGHDQQQQSDYNSAQVTTAVAEFSIDGMSCVSCSKTIERAVLNLEGVTQVVVNLGTDSAKVSWDRSSSVTPPRIQEAIEAVGFGVEDVNLLTTETKRKPQKPRGDNNNNPLEAREMVADILVSGMTCSMCAQSIQNALDAVSGVQVARVVLATDTVHVSYQHTTIEEIMEAIEAVGYSVEGVEYPDDDEESALPPSSSPQNEALDERWQRLNRRQAEKVRKKRQAFLWSLVGTLPILSLTMFLNHIVRHGFLYRHVRIAGHRVEVEALILWILATPVQFLAGFEFYKMTYYNLRNGQPGMDVLVALGTTAAYFYALAGALTGDDMSAHFFETSAVLICFVLAGKWLQALAVRRTSEALTRLMQLQSKTAVRVTPTNATSPATESSSSFNPLKDPYTEAVVPIQDVNKGDMIKVIRGSSIPADGRVVFGAMSVNESMVTGESMPVLKTNGSDVLGGTVCVESDSQTGDSSSVGAAFVEVTGVGSATALAQIIQLVQDAQTRSVPIQTFTDKVSSIFVPAVCLMSLLTYMTWYALCESQVVPPSWYEDLGEDPTTFSLKFGIACLVISCPCALGLATPTAVMVGTGVGAKVGVLMKGGEALEVASKVDSVIFDKTGTLTKGKPTITDFVRVDSNEELTDEYLLWLLGCLERTSEHPLAKAVVSYVERKLPQSYLQDKPFVEPTEFRALTGKGASGMVFGSVKIAAGNRTFAAGQGLAIPRMAEGAMQEMEFLGKTAILVAVDGVVALVLGLADELKPGAKASIEYLRDVMHVDVWMVTGDNERTARAIAAQLSLPPERTISEALPAAKVQQVRKLQDEDHLVAMIGDGINDSPALAQADVGISVGTAAEIAAEASDLVLVKGNVQDVCTALDLSRAIFRRIQLNLLWSLLYNILGIPLAAGAFYPLVQRRLPPTVAALAMALSSVSVVLSSLSLRLYRPPEVARSRRRGHNRATPAASIIPSWLWNREEHSNTTETDDLRQDLLAHDFLSASEVTESTAVVDNRTNLDLNVEEVIVNVVSERRNQQQRRLF